MNYYKVFDKNRKELEVEEKVHPKKGDYNQKLPDKDEVHKANRDFNSLNREAGETDE